MVFKLKDRVVLGEGAWADIVVFDDSKIRDKATFQNPHQVVEGVSDVFINGVPIVEKAAQNALKPGMILCGLGRKHHLHRMLRFFPSCVMVVRECSSVEETSRQIGVCSPQSMKTKFIICLDLGISQSCTYSLVHECPTEPSDIVSSPATFYLLLEENPISCNFNSIL